MATTTGARRDGKTATMLRSIRERLASGEHVHIAGPSGVRCIDGPPGCTVPRRPLAQLEQELRH